MTSSKLLTNYVLSPLWVKTLLFICFYVIVFNFLNFSLVSCVESSETVINPQEEFIIKCIKKVEEQDAIIQKQQAEIQTLKKAVDLQIHILGWTVILIFVYEIIHSFK